MALELKKKAAARCAWAAAVEGVCERTEQVTVGMCGACDLPEAESVGVVLTRLGVPKNQEQNGLGLEDEDRLACIQHLDTHRSLHQRRL